MKKGEINSLKSSMLSNKKRGDLFIPLIVFSVAIFGLVMVYSSSKYSAEVNYHDKFFYLTKQIIGFLIGTVGFIFFSVIDYKKLEKLRVGFLIFSIILLAVVFTPLGVENYGAKRWINLGVFTIQPSEIAKFSYIIFVSGYFNKNHNRTESFLGVLPVVLIGVLLAVLIMLEPNMSITVCVMALMVCMLFLSGVKLKFLFFLILPLLILAPVLIIAEPYRMKRLMAFLNPWASPKGEGYQLIQSLYALGSGGWFGVGLFNSRQKFRFLPFAESDFILSVIGEEFGFVGTSLLFLVFFLLLVRGMRAGIKCKNYFGYLLATGITVIFIIQVCVNALVVMGSIPPTGLPFPLISAGNTSLIVYMSAFGLLYNVSKDGENF